MPELTRRRSAIVVIKFSAHTVDGQQKAAIAALDGDNLPDVLFDISQRTRDIEIFIFLRASGHPRICASNVERARSFVIVRQRKNELASFVSTKT